MAFRIGIVEGSDFSEKALELLRKVGDVSVFDPQHQTLQEFVTSKNALFIRLKHYWDDELLREARGLRYICTPTTGLTHIDIGYAQSSNINIICLKGETEFLKTISATAEHAFGLALALLRRYGQAFLRPDTITWDRDNYKGHEMKGMSAGIIGMGRVGSLLSGYLHAFGVEQYYYDICGDEGNTYQAQRTDSIYALVDAVEIIFLCASYEKVNAHMISRSILKRMKGKYFINTSRGELVEENALLALIKKHHFAGVALDVIEGEPGETRAKDFCALTGTHNVIITPHIAGATYSSMWATEEFIAGKLVTALGGLYR